MPIRPLNNLIRTPLLLLGIVEALLLYLSVYFAGAIAGIGVFSSAQEFAAMAPRAFVATVVILASLISMGLYQFQQRIYFREAAARVAVGVAGGCLMLAVIYYAAPSVMLPKFLALRAAGLALILLLIVRYFFLLRVDENIFRRRTLIYGAGERAASIAELRRRADRRGFKVVGQISAPGDVDGQTTGKHAMIQPDGMKLADLAKKFGAEEIVVAMDDRRGNLPVRELLECRLRGIDVIDVLEFLERETGKIYIELVNPGWLVFAPGFRISVFRRFSKRIVDLAVSLVLLLIAWPIMVFIAVAIKCEDGLRKPVLYRQCRVGQNNHAFNVLKFRSMSVDAEADGQALWAEKNDSRITRVGNFLRNSRLDELPQMLNVLVGQMSIVGPRPERPEFVEELQKKIPYYAERHVVKPGVTGWAQLKYSYGASEEDSAEKLQFDLYYIKNQTLILDLVIILQTVEVVLWGKGAR
jgi:sugar transferase (PEP-CTERM system associated)